MKRILLTTTSLILAAGVAHSEVTFSGSVTAGIARDGAATDTPWDTYSEASLTATGTAEMDNGMSLSAGVSIDSGTGYDFADDDGFDAAKSNGVSLDSVVLNTGAMGTITLNEDAITHLVDGDDDGNADIGYSNTFGSISVSAAFDLDEDSEDATVIDDVQWSAKISMPVGSGSAYAAMDEEGGNAFGGSFGIAGVTVGLDSKLEAAEDSDGTDLDRSTTVSVSYAMGSTTLTATQNSRDDGDQWGLTAAYAAGNTALSLYTDEGQDWSVSGSYALGGGSSLVGGVNYSDDAFLGLSFAF